MQLAAPEAFAGLASMAALEPSSAATMLEPEGEQVELPEQQMEDSGSENMKQKVQKILEHVSSVAETLEIVQGKCTMLESRLDGHAGNVADVCRHMAQALQEYDKEKGEVAFLERKMRPLYEGFGSKIEGHVGGPNGAFEVWKLLCTEVAWRMLRDWVILVKAVEQDLEAMDDEDEKKKYMEGFKESGKALKRGLENCSKKWVCFDLMKHEEVRQKVPRCVKEQVLVWQIVERFDEVKTLMKGMKKTDLVYVEEILELLR